MSMQKQGRFLHYSTPKQRSKGGILSGSETDVSTSNENLSHEERYVLQNTARQEPQGQENKFTQEGYDTLIIHEDSWNPRVHDIPPPMYKAPTKDPSVREINDIPDDYLSQSQVLKHLAKEVKVSGMDSSAESDKSGRHSTRKLRAKLSKSQPDLSALSLSDREKTILRHTLGNSRKDQQRCALMVDHLMKENKSLKIELETCYNKVAKAHKLEEEVGKVTRAHEELVATCERRERLEHARINRLQAEVRRLQEANQRLVTTHLLSPDHSRNHLAKREALIAQLVTQNKELQAAKERQEIELAAQRATLQEQRTHIDILDTALINAQANVVRLEEECRQKQVHVERVGQLQRALSSLQLASDRREQTERKLRLQLEQELQNERAKHSNSQDCNGSGESGESLPELKRHLREKDEKIMRLEGEVAKWEQKYLEESQLRQAAIDAASIPKDAKIAALEKTSQETEKLIAEARSDRIRQMDEVHAAQKRVTDLEAKVKELECKLAERDAMIRVLQNKHTLNKEVSSSYPSISLSHHPSLNTTDLNVLAGDDLGGVSTTSVFSTVSSALTSSTGFGSEAPYSASTADSYHHKFSSPAESFHHKSLDDQLKELDSQILSKRGLCCFPGFSHPGSSSRKGKIPQPLLASVGGFESGGFLQGLVGSSGNRPDDMELLEKQGLCSQQQRQAERCTSLPPSSLPRPKRNKAASRDRKLGEYGRLSDSETTNKTSNNSSADNTDTSRQRESPSRMIPLAPRKLGEYGRLTDNQQERKMSVNSNVDNSEPKRRVSPARSIMPLPPRNYARLADDNKIQDNNEGSRKESPSRSLVQIQDRNYPRIMEEENEKKESKENQRESPSRLMLPRPPRKLGEYGRLSDGEGKNSGNGGCTNGSETTSDIKKPHLDRSTTPVPRSQTVRKTVEFGNTQVANTEIRMTPINKYVHYGRLDEVGKSDSESKSSMPLSNLTSSKLPTRSFLPPPKKLSDYGCFDQTSQNKQDSKLRLIPPGRRGSLHREQPQQKPGGVRSLPTPNKYRIQF